MLECLCSDNRRMMTLIEGTLSTMYEILPTDSSLTVTFPRTRADDSLFDPSK